MTIPAGYMLPPFTLSDASCRKIKPKVCWLCYGCFLYVLCSGVVYVTECMICVSWYVGWRLCGLVNTFHGGDYTSWGICCLCLPSVQRAGKLRPMGMANICFKRRVLLLCVA